MPAILRCFFHVLGIVTCLSPPEYNPRKSTLLRYEDSSTKDTQAIATDADTDEQSFETGLDDLENATDEDDNSTNGTYMISYVPTPRKPSVKDENIARGEFPYTRKDKYQHSPTMITVYITSTVRPGQPRQLHRGTVTINGTKFENVLSWERKFNDKAKWNLKDDGDCEYGDGNCIAIQSAANPSKDDINMYLSYDATHMVKETDEPKLELHRMSESWRVWHAPGGKIRIQDTEDFFLADDGVNPVMVAEHECNATSGNCDFTVNIVSIAWGKDPQGRASKARVAVCMNRIDRPGKRLRMVEKGLEVASDSDLDEQCDKESFTMQQASPGGKPTSATYLVENGLSVISQDGTLSTSYYHERFGGWLLKHQEDDLMTFRDESNEYLEVDDNNKLRLNVVEDMQNPRKWQVRLLNLTFCHGCPPPWYEPHQHEFAATPEQ